MAAVAVPPTPITHLHGVFEMRPELVLTTYSDEVTAASSSSSHAPTASTSSSSKRDPHDLPTFSLDAPPTSPILYLPPVLSSLPPEYTDPSLPPPSPEGQSPLSTDVRLPSIDEASLALHRALHNFRTITPQYASVPYPEAFNWNELQLPESIEHEWYCVMFRSKRRDGSDSGPLYEADAKAHAEAVQNGGLLLYWYGIPDLVTGMNLATCIWQSRAHAQAANGRPHHLRAMRLAAASYDHYELQRYWLTKAKGETGVTVQPFDNALVNRSG